MTNQEILEKAIQKAIDGGWMTILAGTLCEWSVQLSPLDGKTIVVVTKLLSTYSAMSVNDVVFDHDFAKAVWPPKLLKVSVTYHTSDMTHPGERSVLDGWQYHLQQMVTAEDPIKYLGENI